MYNIETKHTEHLPKHFYCVGDGNFDVYFSSQGSGKCQVGIKLGTKNGRTVCHDTIAQFYFQLKLVGDGDKVKKSTESSI